MSPSRVLFTANCLFFFKFFRPILKYIYFRRRYPNLAFPNRYSERMLWRKTLDHNPLFVTLTDKLSAKEYCQRMCPSLEVPKTLWIGKDADRIPASALSGDVFVKSNHGFDFNYAVKNGEVDRQDLKTTTDNWLRSTHGVRYFEWAYTQIEPKLFVEESVGDASKDLLEFSVRCSNGTFILGSVVAHNKLPNKWYTYLDDQGKRNQGIDGPDDPKNAQLPPDLDIVQPYKAAVEYSQQLSRGVDYARYDFMWNGETLYAGEITIYPNAGNGEIPNPHANAHFMKTWDLESSYFLNTEHTGFMKRYSEALSQKLKTLK